jgi:predicted lipoprotein with Yx(FWY)xxD motif
MMRWVVLAGAVLICACADDGAIANLNELHVGEKPSIGSYVTGPGQRAMYVMSIDESGQPSCFSNCSVSWPPVIVDTIPSEVDAKIDRSKLGLTRREDGKYQLTFNRKPLYYAAADTKPGDTWGHNAMSYGGRFSLVAPDGTPVPPP